MNRQTENRHADPHIENAMSNLFCDLARIRDVVINLMPLGERLTITESNADFGERSKLFRDLCAAYEGIIPDENYFSDAAATISPEFARTSSQSNLCASVDDLLDQLADLNLKSRLWAVKARVILDQIKHLAVIESDRLQSAITASEAAPKANRPSFEKSTRTRLEHQLAA